MKPLTLFVVADPTSRYLRRLEELPDEVNIVCGLETGIFADSGADAEVLLVGTWVDRASLEPVFALAPNLKWIHSLSAGLEGLLFPALVESPVVLTNAAGVFAGSLAEWCLAAMLFFAKDLRRLVRNQDGRRWETFDVEMLGGRTLGILGYGGIGQATARLAKAFGMRIVALRRRPRLSGADGIADEVFSPENRMDFFRQCDYIAASLPLTEETRHFVGAPELRAMKSEAVLVNIGRGGLVDEAALVRALQEGWIRGAALDVFAVEPLPAEHAFYGMENVLISPHSADHTATWLEDTMQLFLENFERYRKGEPLRNIVDKRVGY